MIDAPFDTDTEHLFLFLYFKGTSVFFIRLFGSATFTATLKLFHVSNYRNFWNTERWKSFN